MPRTRDNNRRAQQKSRRGVGAQKARALGNPNAKPAKPPHRNNTDRPTPTTDLRK